jgi:replicative DNA helicase
MTDITAVKESEAGLIGATLRDGAVYNRVRDIVKPEHFQCHAFGYAWEAIQRLYERGLSIDTITVGDELERSQKMSVFVDGQWSGRALLSRLRSDGLPSNAESYAENVQDYATKRYLEEIAVKMAYYAKNGRRSSDIILDVEKLFSEIILYSGKSAQHTVPFSKAVSEAYDKTDRAAKGEIIGVPTGFIDLDKQLGSLYGGNLYLIAARPGQGKTAWMLSVAKYAAEHGRKIGIFSIEMMRDQIAQRIISMISGIPLDRIIKGQLEEKEWSIYTNAIDIAATLPITINDLGAINITQIRQEARKMFSNGGVDLLIVDYIQIATPSEKQDRRDLDIGDISSGLKALAKELNVPVLAASQLSRDLEKRSDKRPVLADLRESGSLEQDADVVMFIYRPDQYEKTDKQNTAEIITAKHRNGATGSVELIYRSVLTKFENATSRTFNPNGDYTNK